MQTKVRSKFSLLFVVLALMLALPASAVFADILNVNDLQTSGDTTKSPGDTGDATFYLDNSNTTPTGDTNGCNAGGSTDTTVTLTSSASSKVNFNGSATTSMSLNGCGEPNSRSIAYQVTQNAVPGDVITISGEASGGKAGSQYANDSFKITIVAPPPPPNQAPEVVNDALDVSGPEGSPLTNSGSFSDPDNDALAITKTAGPGQISVNGNSWSWSYTPNDNGSGTVTVQADDGNGGTATDSFDWSADNVAPTATEDFESPVNEGSSFSLALTDPVDPSSVDTAAGFTYAFDCDLTDANAYPGGFTSSASKSCSTNDNGVRSVGAQIKDKDAGVTEYTGSVTVNNVPPTIQTLTASPQGGLLAGKSVTFSGTATDPSSVDTAAGFNWNWSFDGGLTYTPGTGTDNTFVKTFNNCGTYNVKATATDKDGGVSDAKSLSSNPIQVYNASFRPPIDGPATNLTLKGKVLPVKISVVCDGQVISGLSPTIALLNGDVQPGAEGPDDVVEAYSTSGADTTGIMRPVDGGYLYNLQVPGGANVAVGQTFTVRVNPFGTHASNPGGSMYALLKIKK